MDNLRWPVVIITAMLALALWGGVSHYHQRYVKEAPLVEQLAAMEEIAQAEILREGKETIILITPAPAYRGPLPELYVQVEKLALEELNGPLQVKFADRRNERLNQFAREASLSLHEGARLGNYRQVADSIRILAEKYRLTESEFAVDYQRLYLQGRDGDYYLYLIIEVAKPEGGGADA